MLAYHHKTPRTILAFLLPLTLICLLAFLSFSRFFATHNTKLSAGITLDLIFSVPLLHVLLSKRNKNLKYTATLFFSVGILIAGIIIPKNNQFLLREIKFWIAPLIEIFGVTFFVVKTRQALAKYKLAGEANAANDFYTTFKTIAAELMPKRLASIISGEIAAFYYGFFHWRRPVLDEKTYSYHKKTGIVLFIGIFIFMILVETTVFHLVLAKWSVKAAWILTTLSLYAAMQAFGIARSICNRPVKITANRLIIRYGILAETTIDFKDILSVSIADKSAVDDDTVKCLSPLKKIEEPNVLILLNTRCNIEGLYGSKKPFEKLLINIDENDAFIAQMQLFIKPVVGG